MGSIADLFVAVKANMSTFEKEVVTGATASGAKAGKSAGDAMGKSIKDRTKAFFSGGGLGGQLASGLGFMGPVGLAVGGIGTLVNALGDAGRAASDLSETESKLTQVFPDQAVAIKAWSANSAAAMGLSKKAALEAVGTFGNFLQAMGTVPPQAADMSKAMVQLASDLGSFNNQDPTQVLGALQSGLSGETEPLRRFGVDISDAAVQTEAMSMGLEKVGKGFTQGQKIQARYSLIMKQTTKAQGDYARTANGTANATRTAQAEQENLSAAVGEVVNNVQNVVASLVGKGAGGLIHVLDIVGDAWGFLTDLLGPASNAQDTASAAITAATDAIKAQTDALKKNKAEQQEVVDQTAAVTAEWEQFHNQSKSMGKFLGFETTDVIAGFENLGKTAGVGYIQILQLFTALKEAGKTTAEAQDEVTKALMSSEQLAVQMGVSVERANQEIAKRMAVAHESRDVIVEQIRVDLRNGVKFLNEDGTTALTEAGEAAGDAGGTAVGEGFHKALTDADIAAQFTDAFADLPASVVASMKTIPSKVKGQADKIKIVFRTSLQDAKEEVKLRAAEIRDALTHPFRQGQLRKTYKTAMEDAKKAMTKAQKEHNEEAWALAKANYEHLKGEVAKIDALKASIHVAWAIKDAEKAARTAGRSFVYIPGMASGGQVTAGHPYIVGERHAELFVPETNGTIVPDVPGGRQDVYHHISADGARNLMAAGYPASSLSELFIGARRESGARYSTPRPR